MSEDIVDRLRRGITASGGVDIDAGAILQAAAELEGLRSALALLVGAGSLCITDGTIEKARAALEGRYPDFTYRPRRVPA